MWPNPQETADLVAFSEEILNGKLHFLCSNGQLKSKRLPFSLTTVAQHFVNQIKCDFPIFFPNQMFVYIDFNLLTSIFDFGLEVRKAQKLIW